MKKLFLVMLVMLMGTTLQAQEKKSKNAKHELTVKGNCEMCKKRIEKAAYSVAGVKSAAWDMENKGLQIIMDDNKANVEEVHTAVAKAGHDTDKQKAKDEDYEKLHACCSYDRG